MSLALAHTYRLNQWKMVWTMFIKKELGNPDLNKLCMIFKAEWQSLSNGIHCMASFPKAKKHTL